MSDSAEFGPMPHVHRHRWSCRLREVETLIAEARDEVESGAGYALPSDEPHFECPAGLAYFRDWSAQMDAYAAFIRGKIMELRRVEKNGSPEVLPRVGSLWRRRSRFLPYFFRVLAVHHGERPEIGNGTYIVAETMRRIDGPRTGVECHGLSMFHDRAFEVFEGPSGLIALHQGPALFREKWAGQIKAYR